jgi:hypothetical protein
MPKNNCSDDTSNSRDDIEYPPLPEELEYLLEPAIRYGRQYKFDDQVQWFLENASESDIETLAALAERARLSGSYACYRQWSYEVDDAINRVVDTCYPYTVDISAERRKEFLRLINEAVDPPEIAERRREKRLRMIAEASDRSEIAKHRRDMRGRSITESNDLLHHMDIYFLFGLMDACDMEFE